MATLAEGRKAVACSHPLDPKSTQSLPAGLEVWSAYEAIDDYETFGWWDLQGDGTHSDVVDAEAGFEPFDDATNYYGEEDYADAFDDEGFSARYFDQG